MSGFDSVRRVAEKACDHLRTMARPGKQPAIPAPTLSMRKKRKNRPKSQAVQTAPADPLLEENKRLRLALVRARQASERDGTRAYASLSSDNHRLRAALEATRQHNQGAADILAFALREASTGVLEPQEWVDLVRRAREKLSEWDIAPLKNSRNGLSC